MNQEQGSIELPADKAYYLQKIEVLQEIEGEILVWAKKRFWMLSILITGIALLGGTTLISSTIESRVNSKISEKISRYESKLEELREATIQASLATSDAEEAAKQTEKVLSNLYSDTETYSETVRVLNTRAKNLRNDFANTSAKNLSVVEDLLKDVSSLANVVAELSISDEELTKAVTTIKTSLDSSEENISKAVAQTQLNRFEVLINSFPGGEILMNKLNDIGVSASYDTEGPAKDNPSNYLTIRIGNKVPLKIATKTIRLAKNEIADLAYVKISESDVESNRIRVGYSSLDNMNHFSKSDFKSIIDSTTASGLERNVRNALLKNTIGE